MCKEHYSNEKVRGVGKGFVRLWFQSSALVLFPKPRKIGRDYKVHSTSTCRSETYYTNLSVITNNSPIVESNLEFKRILNSGTCDILNCREGTNGLSQTNFHPRVNFSVPFLVLFPTTPLYMSEKEREDTVVVSRERESNYGREFRSN